MIKNLNVKKIRNKGIMYTLVCAGIIGGSIVLSSFDCDIKDKHVHKYVNYEGYIKYSDSELMKVGSFKKTDDIKFIKDEELDKYRLINEKNLIEIDKNYNVIKKFQNSYINMNHIEYKYKSFQNKHILKKWSYYNKKYLSTGEIRHCNYLFRAYKLKKKDDEYILISSPYTYDVTEYMKEYPYIKRNEVFVLDDYGNICDDVSKNINELNNLKGKYPKSFDNNNVKTYSLKK